MLQDDLFNQTIADAYELQQPYRDVPHPRVMLIFSGISGSGKTTLGKRLADDLQAQYINHDDIRAMMRARGIDPGKVFMPPISRLMINRIMKHDRNKFIIIDGSLDRTWDIYFAHVKELGAVPIVIRMQVPVEIIRERLASRDGTDHDHLRQLDRFITEFENCCRHVEADVTVGEMYDYTQVFQAVRDKVADMGSGVQ